MITFGRNGNKVIIKIEHGIFGGTEYFELDIYQNQDYQAELLMKAFQENLSKRQKEMKEKYYNEGWADAKAKRKKRTGERFWGGWF